MTLQYAARPPGGAKSCVCCCRHECRRTSSQVTTVGPSQEAKGRPWRQASSSRSCLKKAGQNFAQVSLFRLVF